MQEQKAISQTGTAKVKQYLLFLPFIAAIYFIYLYLHYLDITGFRIPIMDFCRWIAWYGEKFHQGTMSFMDFFSDKNEQVQPLSLGIIFSVLETSQYNTWPLVIWGGILRILLTFVTAFFVIRETEKSDSYDKKLFAFFGAATVILAGLNLNQWELTNEPFTLTMSVRLICFFLTFLYLSHILKNLLTRSFRYQILSILLLSVLAAAVSLLLSGAYFAAYLGSISLTLLIFCIINRKEIKLVHIPLMLIWAMTVGACFLFYLKSMSGGMPMGTNMPLLQYIRGFVIYIGAAVIPQYHSETTLTPFVIAGICLIAFACLIFCVLIRTKRLSKAYIALMLILYCIINGIVIAYGRVGYYGAGTMASSRYTVESILGLTGLIWAAVICFPNAKKENFIKAILYAGMAAIIVSSAYCYKIEADIAIYRAEYQEQMKEQMLRIDEATDEELTIFQENPEYVRTMVDFFRDNQLSVFVQD